MNAVTWLRRPAKHLRPAVAPAAAATLTGLLAAAGLLSLWISPPPVAEQWHVIWELTLGAGFAAAGCAVISANRPDQPAPDLPGRLFVLAAVLLLSAPPALAVGLRTTAHIAAVLAAAIVIPLALLRIVQHPATTARPAVTALRGLELAVVLAGTVSVAAAAIPAPTVAIAAAFVVSLAVFCSGWLQFELTGGDSRRQVLWVILGVGTSVPTGALFLTFADSTSLGATAIAVLTAVLSLLLPLSAAVALIAPRVVDVRALISQVVVLAVMTTLTVAIYGGAESGLELLTGTPGEPGQRALLAAAVAAGFHPVMLRVRAATDEMLFGGRADPVGALSRLGSQLTAGTSPQEWLDTLRHALVVPGVVLLQDGEPIAGSGELGECATVVTELRTGTEHVGDLIVALPADQLRLTPSTQAVLGLVAAPLAQALHAIRLSEQLRVSRGRVVAALEEERRRVRRDLHDGLGPTLTGIAYSADAAANLVGQDGDHAIQVLRELRADAGEAIAEIRRIVYGLRPKALDELGLVGAVTQRVSHLRAAGGGGLTVSISAPDELPELAAAVEVAAYRTAVEAVTNVARHAGVSRATLDFAVLSGTTLRITVCDEGSSSRPWTPGVGLDSMRERVEQIGGTLTVDGGTGGGRVRADLPLTLAG